MAEQQTRQRPMGDGREAQQSSPYELGYGDCARIIDGGGCRATFDSTSTGACASPASSRRTRRRRAPIRSSRAAISAGASTSCGQAYVRRRGEKRRLRARAHARARGRRAQDRRRAAVVAHGEALGRQPLRRRVSRSVLAVADAATTRAGSPSPAASTPRIPTTRSGARSRQLARISSGNDDGGPLPATINDPTSAAPVTGKAQRETPRTWITWTDYVRLVVVVRRLHRPGARRDGRGRRAADAARRAGDAARRQAPDVPRRLRSLSAFAIEMWLTQALRRPRRSYGGHDREQPRRQSHGARRGLRQHRPSRSARRRCSSTGASASARWCRSPTIRSSSSPATRSAPGTA